MWVRLSTDWMIFLSHSVNQFLKNYSEKSLADDEIRPTFASQLDLSFCCLEL